MDSTLLVVLLVFLGISALVTLAVVIWFIVRLRRLSGQVHSDLMPLQGKIAYWTAIVYTIFPVDLLPDPIYLDDIGVVAGTIAYLHTLIRRHRIGTPTPVDTDRRNSALPRP
jgi:uncharacterized membrane protein YkvA (DUF1232 family)